MTKVWSHFFSSTVFLVSKVLLNFCYTHLSGLFPSFLSILCSFSSKTKGGWLLNVMPKHWSPQFNPIPPPPKMLGSTVLEGGELGGSLCGMNVEGMNVKVGEDGRVRTGGRLCGRVKKMSVCWWRWVLERVMSVNVGWSKCLAVTFINWTPSVQTKLNIRWGRKREVNWIMECNKKSSKLDKKKVWRRKVQNGLSKSHFVIFYNTSVKPRWTADI